MSIVRGAWAWLRHHALQIFAGLAVLYLLVPIIVIAVFSFGATPKDKLTFGLNDGLTTEYWRTAFSVPQLNDALRTSLELAALATAISTVIGTRTRGVDGVLVWSQTSEYHLPTGASGRIRAVSW